MVVYAFILIINQKDKLTFVSQTLGVTIVVEFTLESNVQRANSISQNCRIKPLKVFFDKLKNLKLC